MQTRAVSNLGSIHEDHTLHQIAHKHDEYHEDDIHHCIRHPFHKYDDHQKYYHRVSMDSTFVEKENGSVQGASSGHHLDWHSP